jgi:hypothetical protein
MTEDKNHESWRKATAMTRAEIIAECLEAKHEHEISDACARAIVRLHGNSRDLTVAAFVLHGALPPDDDRYPHAASALHGGTKLWRMLFGRYSYMSRDDRLMADMLGTYLLNCVPPRRRSSMTTPGNTQISAWADRIMTQIDEDMASGQVPPDAASFAELHDHVDANDYLDAAGVPWGTDLPGQDDDPAGVRIVRAVQDEVTRRLAGRRTKQ